MSPLPRSHKIPEFVRSWGLSPALDGPVIVVALIMIGLAVATTPLQEAMRYERAAILEGEWWRLLTGHLTHLNWGHLLLNLAGLGLVWLLFRRDYRPTEWGLIALASMVAIDTGFLLIDTQLVWYVGLSGVLHGLMVAGAMHWGVEDGWAAWGLLMLLLAKLVYEQLVGPMPFTADAAGGPVVVNSHLYGAIGGGTCAAFIILRQRGLQRV